MRAVFVTAAAGLAALFVATGNGGGRPETHAVRPGGINVEPSMRPWRYVGANPDGWWCERGACNGVANGTVFVNRELKLIARLHVRLLRLEFPRPLIEPRRGVYDWRRADYIVRRARHFHVKLLPLLLYTPSWDGATPATPPHPATWYAFVAAFAHRYRASIDAYDLWDEPDFHYYWTGDAKDYVQDVLVPGYRAVKKQDPSARVILGGPQTANIDWLNAIYANGGGTFFDVMQFHDYIADKQIFDHAQQVLGVLRAHGQPRKPIWLGEYGLQEAGVNDVHQAALVQLVLTGKSSIALAAWYSLRDDDVMTCCPPSLVKHETYGVMTKQYVPKRGFATMRQLLVSP
ncbi:MAG: glycosyl hydrolase [Gaiellaceae bacterium]